MARRLARRAPRRALHGATSGARTRRRATSPTKRSSKWWSEPGLRERNFGIFEGLTNAEIEVRHPDLHALFEKRDPHFVMPGGESAAQFHERCLGTLRSIAERHDGESVVVVSHGLVLDALYRAACRMPLQVPRGFPLLNCSISTFRYTAKGWLVVAVCDVQHLACEDMTSASDASVQVPADRASA